MVILFLLFRVLILFALLLLQSCQNIEAEKIVKTEKNVKRQNAATYNTQLGIAYLNQDDRPRAKKKLLTALTLAPDSSEVNGAMAYYLEKTGDMNEARAFYQRALSLSPNSGAQLNNYGAFLCRQGKYKEAENYFIQAVKDVQYVHTAGAYENAGLCAEAIPDYNKASTYFIKALEHDPVLKQSLYELVTVELKQNNAEDALINLKKYQTIVLNDKTLLALAIDASHKAGKSDIAAEYQQHLIK